MFNLFINTVKASLIIFWFVAILTIAKLINLPYSDEVLIVAVVLIIAHIAEYVALPLTLFKGKEIKISFIQTLLFGFGHWLPLLQANKSKL